MTAGLTPDERAALEAARHDPRRHVGPLVVLRELGRGGMGQVLLAYDSRRGALVAVKTLLERATSTARARLEREARLLGGLAVPGIARLHEAVFEGPGAPYLVMEFVRGRPLSSLIDEDEPMAPRRAAALVSRIARAVAAAHAAGVVHRDLKPQNVMISDGDGQPVVLDFGLARSEQGSTVDLTRTGSVVGTLAYLAPEQIGQAKRADAQADVYALGGILFNCLTGRVPFDGAAAIVLAQVMTQPPPAPSEHVPGLPRALDALVLRCLAKDPQARPAGAEEVARALEAWLEAPDDAGASTAVRRSETRAGLAGQTPSRPTDGRSSSRGRRADCEGRTTPTGRGPPRAAWLAAALLAALGLAAAAVGLLAPRLEREDADPPPAPAPPPRATDPPPDDPPGAPPSEVDRLLGESVAVQDDPSAAEALCTRALALDPGRADAYAARGQFRYRQGNYRGAADDYLEAARRDPQAAHHHVNAGVNLLRAGDVDAALASFDRALTLEPDQVAARVGRADALVRQGQFEAAARDLEVALARAPRDADALAQLGFLRYRRKDHAGAVEAYTRAIAASPRQPMLWVNRAFNLGEVGRREDAAADLEEALRLAPDLPEAWRARGFLRLDLGDLAGAASDFERCLELDPTLTRVRQQLALVREALAKQEQQARRASEAARAEALTLVERAKKLGSRSFDEAEALFARALELAPDLAEIWAARGFLRYRRGASRGAADDYAQAARLDPDRASNHYNLAVNLSDAGDREGALRAYDRALELSPDRPDAVAGRAKTLHHLGRDQEAVTQLEAVLARRPDDVDALDALGYIQFDRREHEQAVATFTRALALEPGRHILRVNRAVNLASLRRHEEALRDCDIVLAAAPDHVPALLTRGDVRLELNDAAGAVRDLERALELAPDDPSTRRKLARARERLGR